MTTQLRLTKPQQDALNLITRVGRVQVGRYGGINQTTVNVLVRHGLVRIEKEYRREKMFRFAVPVLTATS